MNCHKFLECFYGRFLLREFLGKMVPGGIVLTGFFHGSHRHAIESYPFVLWVFLVGVAWLTGFAVQAIWKHLYSCWWQPMDNEAAEKLVEERIEVLNRFSEEERKDFERLGVIAEICRNGGMALILVVVVALARSVGSAAYVILLFGILAIIGLLVFADYCEKIKAAYRKRVVPTPATRAPRKTAKKKTPTRKIAKKKTVKRKTAKRKRS